MHLNGVQGVGGSNPLVPTIIRDYEGLATERWLAPFFSGLELIRGMAVKRLASTGGFNFGLKEARQVLVQALKGLGYF